MVVNMTKTGNYNFQLVLISLHNSSVFKYTQGELLPETNKVSELCHVVSYKVSTFVVCFGVTEPSLEHV